MPANPWPAPAKLNLLLNITGRRDDGYHLLQTVFQFLDIGDRLWFTCSDDDRIHRDYQLPDTPPEQDLILRAARLLRARRPGPGAHIRLDKVLPMGGGLGGGSSDAATTLVALNRLWGLNLPPAELCALGLELGADVPVFIHGHACWAEGVGEHFTDLELEEPWYLVIHPGVHVATREIFSAPELTRQGPAIKIRGFSQGQGVNLCEPVVRARYPEVDRAMAWLDRHGRAQLTGTGACIFCTVADRQRGEEILDLIPYPWKGFIARGRNHSPLMARLADQGDGAD